MSSPYIGEIRLVGFNFAPSGWAFCDGALQSVSQNEALFALVGTTYGGDGMNTFALPNLSGRVLIHQGTGLGSPYAMGQTGGVSVVTLTSNQMPTHNHPVSCQNGSGNATSPSNAYFASSSPGIYASPASNYVGMGSTVGLAGGGLSHDNMQPYLVMNYIISLFGVFPTQN